MSGMAKAKKKAKRYTAEQKKEILDFIANEGRGGQTKAVTKFKVTAATIASWRRKEGGFSISAVGAGGSKELRAVEELTNLLKEIANAEAHLDNLKKAYNKAKTKL
ncbi:MAG: transposase-like protein [Paracoccaceae bacterium]|jgi:transposase-like protein